MKKCFCNKCGCDLTESLCGESRLLLMNEKIPYGEGPTMDVFIYPILNHDHHFCSLRCLKEWVNEKF